MPECEICKAEVPEDELVSVPSARMFKLASDDFVPDRLPKSEGLEFAEEVWTRTVKEKKESTWRLCRECERETEAFSPTKSLKKRARPTSTAVAVKPKSSKWDFALGGVFILVTIGLMAWCYWELFTKH